jgi:hypothetical protein
MTGIEAIIKALGILGTMISVRVAIAALQRETKPDRDLKEQTEVLRRIEARLAMMQEPEATEDYYSW